MTSPKKKPTCSHEEWTPEDCYLEPSRWKEWPVRLVPMGAKVAARRFTGKFIAGVQAETRWDPMDALACLTPDNIALMVNQGIQCPVCVQGLDWVRFRGLDSGIIVSIQKDHGCERHACVGKLWRFLVPKKQYRDIRLASLKPSSKTSLPEPIHQGLIHTMQQYPESSFLMAGPVNTGKTHSGYSLLYEAVDRWSTAWAGDPNLGDQSVFWIEHTGALLDDIQTWKLNRKDPRVKQPAVTAEQIHRLIARGHKVFLGLDELDKFSATEPRLNNLYELIVAVDDGEGQIIAMANKTQTRLKQDWADFTAGSAIIRRLCGSAARGRYLKFYPPPTSSTEPSGGGAA
jgi:hypothetical protein